MLCLQRFKEMPEMRWHRSHKIVESRNDSDRCVSVPDHKLGGVSMGFLYHNPGTGRIECPPCPRCSSSHTSEGQEVDRDRDVGGKIRVIYIECYKCKARSRVDVYRNLGGHSFMRIGD